MRFDHPNSHAFTPTHIGRPAGLFLHRQQNALPRFVTLGHLDPPIQRVPAASLGQLIDHLLDNEPGGVGARCPVIADRDMVLDRAVFVAAVRHQVGHVGHAALREGGKLLVAHEMGYESFGKTILAKRGLVGPPDRWALAVLRDVFLARTDYLDRPSNRRRNGGCLPVHIHVVAATEAAAQIGLVQKHVLGVAPQLVGNLVQGTSDVLGKGPDVDPVVLHVSYGTGRHHCRVGFERPVVDFADYLIGGSLNDPVRRIVIHATVQPAADIAVLVEYKCPRLRYQLHRLGHLAFGAD